MLTILSAGAALVGIATGGVKLSQWLMSRRRRRREMAAANSTQPSYPVRLTCKRETEFHPGAGYREGLAFEAFNQSNSRAQVKRFGLEIRLRHQDDWYEYVTPGRPPPRYEFPLWLEPNEALDGFVDIEAVMDGFHAEGTYEYLVDWKPFVEVSGFGKRYVEIED